MSKIPSRKAFWGAVLVQLAILQVGAAHKYYLRSTGTEIKMKTVPVDPRSLMRGDYVRLQFPMNVVNVPGDLPLREKSKLVKGNLVWVRLDIDNNGLAIPTEVSDRPYATGLQLKGRAEKIRGTKHSLNFGLDAWFIEEGTGKVLEDRARRTGVTATISVLRDGRSFLVDVS